MARHDYWNAEELEEALPEQVDELETISEEWPEGIHFPEGISLEKLIKRYEVLVFTLAMHLTSDEESARKVVADVFVRLGREHHTIKEEPLDSIIHRFTYDAAIPLLLGQIQQKAEDLEDCGEEAHEMLRMMIC
jgi:hypothetical protein